MVDVDRVVGRLGQLVQDAYAAPCHCSSGEYCRAEILLAYGLRAGEGKEDTTGLNLLEGLDVSLR